MRAASDATCCGVWTRKYAVIDLNPLANRGKRDTSCAPVVQLFVDADADVDQVVERQQKPRV